MDAGIFANDRDLLAFEYKSLSCPYLFSVFSLNLLNIGLKLIKQNDCNR